MMKISDPKLFASIKTFLTVYLTKVRARSPHTIQAHKDALNLFILFLKTVNGTELRKVTASDFNSKNVVAYLDWLKSERGCTYSTINQRLSSIRVFCAFLSGEDALAFDTYAKIQKITRRPIPKRHLDDILTADDVKTLLELPDISRKCGLRDRFYMALLYDSGCRNDEILSLKLGDISPCKEGGQVGVIGKGKKFRVTPISKEVIAMLHQYVNVFHTDRDPNRPLFYTDRKGVEASMSPDNAARILLKFEAKAKLTRPDFPHLHPHYFRHVRAIHLYQAGMPLALVGEWLGHTQLETTLIYAYADAEMKRIAADKVASSRPSVFTDELFVFRDDDATIRKLYGLD